MSSSTRLPACTMRTAPTLKQDQLCFFPSRPPPFFSSFFASRIATLHNRMYELAVVTSTVRWAAIKTKMFVRQLLIVLGLLHFVARLIPSLRTPSYVPGEFPPSALLEGPEAAAAEAERAHTEGPKAAGGAGSRGRRIPPPHMHGHHNCDD